ncbi:hypothetical protein [Endozoicomonas sp.]|uniref:hypothetical protein n=1 Tax=Endozoicomonas sp. TaxID=1892382 RepID=UPI002887192B|nr:hypothetical protein [Endozoicomonas sp.]
MQCEFCGSSGNSVIPKAGQLNDIEKNGSSTAETQLKGVEVRIQKEIRTFMDAQYKDITYPFAGTTGIRYQLYLRFIEVLNEQQMPPCQMRIVYGTDTKTSAEASDNTCVQSQNSKQVPSEILDKIKPFIGGLYQIIGEKHSGTTLARFSLADWAKEVLNEDQSIQCHMRVVVGSGTQASGRGIDYSYYYSSSRIAMPADCRVLPIEQSRESINDQRPEEEFVFAPKSTNPEEGSCHFKEVPGSTHANKSSGSDSSDTLEAEDGYYSHEGGNPILFLQ